VEEKIMDEQEEQDICTDCPDAKKCKDRDCFLDQLSHCVIEGCASFLTAEELDGALELREDEDEEG
jgi:hypothetical protein